MRVRHKYQCSFEGGPGTNVDEFPPTFEVRNPRESDGPELASLMFDSYQGTIDYNGETLQEGVAEVKSYFERPDWKPLLHCSFVLVSDDHIISACLVSTGEKTPGPLISYVMTRSNFKGQGLAKAIVQRALQTIRSAGYGGAAATVTEGNTPLEKLLVGLGFSRVDAGL